MSISKSAGLRATTNPYEQLRKAMFRPVPIIIGGERQTRSWISAYFTKITTEAAKGNTKALQEQNWYMKRLDGRGQLAVTDSGIEMMAIEKSDLKHETMTAMAVKLVVALSEHIRPQLKRQYESVYGKIEGFDDLLPDIFPQKFYQQYIPSLTQFQKKFRPKNLDVGFGSTPVHSRFQKGQSGNPSGKRRLSDKPWSVFRDSLAALVTVTIDGVAASRPTVYVAGIVLCAQAMAGNAQARRLVRDLIVTLDDKGLLTPPEKRRRRRRVPLPKSQYDDLLTLMKAAIERQLPQVEESLARAAAKRYGPLSIAAP